MEAKKYCKDCREYNGDCGKHITDEIGHVNYEKAKNIEECFKPSQEYQEYKDNETADALARKYSAKILERAVEAKKLYENAKDMVYVGYSQHDCESWYECPNCKIRYGSWGMLGKRTVQCKCGIALRVPR